MRAEKKGERGAVTLDIGEIRQMERAAIAKLKDLAEGGAKILGRSETLRKRYDQTGTLRVNQYGGVEALKRIPIQDIKLMPGNHLYPDKVKEYQGRPDAPNPELRITPDGKFVVYDGNHRVEAARNRGDKDVLAWVSKPDGATGYPSSEPVRYAYASTQVNLPKPLAQKIQRASKSLISDRDLAPDGREMESHITIRWGLHGEDPAVIQRLLEHEPPVKVKLGKVSTFPDSGDGEVVKIDVDSPDLHRLNKKITDALPSTSTHAGYGPHVTLAYVRPGTGKKYVGSDVLAGQEVTIPTITFSDRSGKQHAIRLMGKSREFPKFEEYADELLSGKVYHGTTREAAEEIVRGGFKPLSIAEEVQRALRANGKTISDLTSDQKQALGSLAVSYANQLRKVSTTPYKSIAERWAGVGGEVAATVEHIVTGTKGWRAADSKVKGPPAIVQGRLDPIPEMHQKQLTRTIDYVRDLLRAGEIKEAEAIHDMAEYFDTRVDPSIVKDLRLLGVAIPVVFMTEQDRQRGRP